MTTLSKTPALKQKLFWVGILYFAEGFPLGAFYDIFPVHFRQMGVDLKSIGLLSLLSLAWSIKFLWAPAIDHTRHHRRWIFFMHILMASVMGLFALQFEFGPWVWVAIGAFTLLSATNDVAIDGYTIEMLNKNEMGRANGLRIGFYRVGMIAAGSVLILSDVLGWAGAYLLCALLFVFIGFICLKAPQEQSKPKKQGFDPGKEIRLLLREPLIALPAVLLIAGLLCGAFARGEYTQILQLCAGALICSALIIVSWSHFVSKKPAGAKKALDQASKGILFGAFLSLMNRKYFWPIVGFILLFKLADTSIGFMIKPFWVDAGFTASQIGFFSVNLGLVLSIAGGIAGGWFTDRYGLFTGLWVLGLTQMLSNFGYVWAAYAIPTGTGVDPTAMQTFGLYSASAVESFTQGLGTGAFLAFLMAIVNTSRAASEYAILSSIFALSRAVAGWAGGYGAAHFGYGDFFFLTILLGLPAYALLPFVKKSLETPSMKAT